MIRLDGVTKSYLLQDGRRKYVLRDLSLVIPTGVNIGLLGCNGAGKTTLLRLLGGIDFPDRGTIETQQRISPPFGLKGGFTGTLSGRENAKFICRIQGDSEDVMRERLRGIADFAELGEYFEMPFRTYSSGMRARLAFSISMAFDYDYYLIDELVAVGDRKFRKKARAAFAEKRSKASTILVSHNMRMHRIESDVGIYLKDGHAHFFDDITEAIATYERDMGGAGEQDLSRGEEARAGTRTELDEDGD